MTVIERAITVLHVDDEPDLGELVGSFLEREDDRITVETVTDPADGYDYIVDNDVGCVVSDYDMPGQNGIEFLESVRAEYPDLPFILYTGKGSEEVASDAISAGVTDYMQKGSGTDQYTVLAHRVLNSVEQYRSQQRAERTRRRLEELSESTTDCLWMFDREWEDLLFISGYEAVWGRPESEIRENPQAFLDGVHPEDRAFVRENMDRLSNGESVDIEYRIVRDDGDVGTVWVKGDPIVDDDGTVARVVGFVRDITDRRQRQSELETVQRQFDAVMENARTPMFMKDDDGEYVFVSQEYRDLFGLDDEDVVGRTDHDIHPDGVADELQRDDQRVLERAEPVETEERLVVDGEARTFRSTKVPIHNTGTRSDPDEPVAVFGVATDITEHKQRERELQRYRAYLEASPDAITVLDESGTVVYQSPAIERILGYDAAAFVDETVTEFVHPEDRPAVTELYTDRLAEPGSTATVECRFETADGEYRWLDVRGTSCLGQAPIDGILTSSRDVTERHE